MRTAGILALCIASSRLIANILVRAKSETRLLAVNLVIAAGLLPLLAALDFFAVLGVVVLIAYVIVDIARDVLGDASEGIKTSTIATYFKAQALSDLIEGDTALTREEKDARQLAVEAFAATEMPSQKKDSDKDE